MTSDSRIKVIVNPAAGNGCPPRKWHRIDKLLATNLGKTSIEFTTQPGDATEFARAALKQGFNSIVAMGGDGTINEVVNGFFEDGCVINPAACLGIIPTGTGSDLKRTLELPADIGAAVQRIAAGASRRCDAGILTCQTLDNQPTQRYFINIADAGFGGALTDRLAYSKMVPGHFFTYLGGLLKTLLRYQNQPMKVEIDGALVTDQILNSVVVANGQFFGGGMRIAPEARMDDGLFDVIVIGDISRWEVIANIPKLYSGKLADHPKVRTFRAKNVRLSTNEEILIDADGELPGKLPATFEILPGKLNIII